MRLKRGIDASGDKCVAALEQLGRGLRRARGAPREQIFLQEELGRFGPHDVRAARAQSL